MKKKVQAKLHLSIRIIAGGWYATDSKGKWLTAQETAQAVADGATYTIS